VVREEEKAAVKKRHVAEVTSREMEWLNQNVTLYDDQKTKVYDAVYAYELDDMDTSESWAEKPWAEIREQIRNTPNPEEKALSVVLTPAQLVLFKKAAEIRMQEQQRLWGLSGETPPPVDLTYDHWMPHSGPKPSPLLTPLPPVKLSY
jgi:hypothetical protein